VTVDPAEVALWEAQPDALRFGRQRGVAADPSKHVALLCGRRSGKTVEIAYEAVEALATYERCHVIFVGLSQKSARRIFFSTVRSLNALHGWGLKVTTHPMEITDPRTGSTILVFGSDSREDLDRIRGIERLALLICDEAGAWRPSLMQYVTEESGGPALMDLDGRTMLSGTPGPVLCGWWYDVTTGGVPGWSLHHWTSYDNPHVPAATWLAEMLERKGWDESNPIYRREYLAEWCVSEGFTVFDWRDSLHTDPPADTRFTTLLAVDFGVVHSTAFVVLGWHPSHRPVRVVCSEKQAGLAPTQVADRIKALQEEHDCIRIIGDLGGLGKAYSQEMAVRHQIYIEPAEKKNRRANLELAVDGIRTGNIEVDKGRNDALIRELKVLQWDEEHGDIAPGQDDDLTDALIYGYQAIHHAHVPPAEPDPDKAPTIQTRPKQYWHVDLGTR
jgi:hypothetical protein